MINIDKVTKQYHYSNTATIEELSVYIGNGLHTLLIDTQSGKTTLVKLLLGIEQCDSGSITLLGEEPTTRQDVALLDSSLLLFRRRSVLYNLMYPLLVRGISRQQAKSIATQQASLYHLDDSVTRHARTLSLDRQIMLAVARATIVDRQLIVCDSLDDICSKQRWQWVVDRLCASADNVLILTRNMHHAVGDVTVIQHNKVVHTGNADSAIQALGTTMWLDNLIGECNE